MPRKGNAVFIPNTAKTSVAVIDLDHIPEEVKQDAEEAYTALKGNPNGRLQLEFDTEAEALEWCAQMRSFCEQREPALRFRRSPLRGAAKAPGRVQYRVTDIADEDPSDSVEQRQAEREAAGKPRRGRPKKNASE